MENIVNKLKSYFASNFGKLTLFITSLSFLATLILSIILKNRIDISILKALISSVITIFILYALNIALKKYLADIIEASNIETISSVSDDSLDNNSNNDLQEETNNLQSPNLQSLSDGDILNELNQENNSASILDDISTPKETLKNDFNIDKNNKVDYHNLRGDIGDIILGNSSYKSPSDISMTSEYYGGDKKVNERAIEREVMDNPDKAAAAVRTVLAKEKGMDKKES